ncbi:MAG TPA: pre-peptidase C-terminal domain-containing protein [Gemmatimonadales bacterium]|nr:pre-peptidase C-terminal domain-containing protein [Gemmatimonadales bacterium]
MDVSALDDQGNRISTAFEVTDPGSGISIRRDSTFLPVYIDDTTLTVQPEATVFRYIVTANAYTTTSFTVSSGGVDITVPVHVVAENVLQAEVSDTEPALNELVTITAPAGVTFTPTSTVTFVGAAVQPAEVTVAADGQSLTFLPPPNITGAQALITDVSSVGSPGVLYSPTTTARFTTPQLLVFDGTVSNLAPVANEAITVTLNPNTTFDPATATFQVGAAPATLIGATANTATLIPAPGSSGLLFINGAVIDSLPQFALTLSNAETDTVVVGAAGTAAGTDDPSTAPSVAVPDPGFSAPFFDTADFVASADRFYKLVVPADGDYTISLDWTSGSDIDLFVCPAAGVATFDCDFTAATGAQPETAVYSLTAGTYYLVAEDFGGDAGTASTLSITVAR